MTETETRGTEAGRQRQVGAVFFFGAAMALAVACGGTSDPSVGSGDDAGAGADNDGGSQGDDASGTANDGGAHGDAFAAGGTDCASTFARLCQRGCDCSGDACRFVVANDAGASGSYEWATYDECANFFAYMCTTQAIDPADLAACSTDVATAACRTDNGKTGLESPASCNAIGKN